MNKIIDLTFDIYDGMITFPSNWHPRTEITILGRHKLEGRATRKITFGTHTGTHVDAPLHMIEGGKSIDEVNLDKIVGNAAIINLSNTNLRNGITYQDLNAEGGNVQDSDIVIIRTDWWKKWGERAFYFEHPFLTEGACKWLFEHQVRTVAIDIPNIDNPTEELPPGTPGPMHVLLMSSDVTVIENLTKLDRITSKSIFFVALPLKIKGADGSPARVIAIEMD